MVDMLDAFLVQASVAMSSATNVAIAGALVVATAVLAGLGGVMGPKMRVYGALAGGLLVNLVVKAVGGGYVAALVAMLVVGATGLALGCAPLVLRALLERLQRR